MDYQYPIINQGVVSDIESGAKFDFRMFLNMALGWAFLYPKNKSSEHLMTEMEILNSENRKMMVMSQHKDEDGAIINQVFPIYWDEDNLPHSPVACINVYAGMLGDVLRLESIEKEFMKNHESLFYVFNKHFDYEDFMKNSYGK